MLQHDIIAIRVGSVLVCLFLFFGIARGAVKPLPIVAALGAAACLSIALVSYRAHIDMDEIQVRYWPFFTKRTQIKDVVAIAEERTLVFVTPTSRIPIWGLTAKAREHLSEMLPHRLRVSETPARRLAIPVLSSAGMCGGPCFSPSPFSPRLPSRFPSYMGTLGTPTWSRLDDISCSFVFVCSFLLSFKVDSPMYSGPISETWTKSIGLTDRNKTRRGARSRRSPS